MATDRFGRRINYLRISLTDHCNLRCVYCMPEDITFRPNAELMQDDELLKLVNSAPARASAAAVNGPILTVRRAIDMLGLDGVRRAALGLGELAARGGRAGQRGPGAQDGRAGAGRGVRLAGALGS